jgi:ADP-dependent NAD(P)H-hydrate dehydratase / NAD(P)H-hydrate epimerase
VKIFQTDQIRQLDAQTIELEKITSIHLMDRTARALAEHLQTFLKTTDKILVIAGPGNNGGDALAVSRFLLEGGFQVETLLCQPDAKVSRDTLEQLINLQQTEGANIRSLSSTDMLSTLKGNWNYLIDGLFGTGLNRPLRGYFAEIVQWINQQPGFVLSIDLPSGLFGEDNRMNLHPNIVRANLTIGLQFPRLSFLMAENESYIGKWILVDIGILPEAEERLSTPYFLTTLQEVKPLLKTRSLHAHKGSFGKVLLLAGSSEMTGAAILGLRGALRSGAGLVFLHIPKEAAPVIQASVPEAIIGTEESEIKDLSVFAGIAIGPGIGSDPVQIAGMKSLLEQKPKNLVLDADALNYLAKHPEELENLPPETILTPHPKEFDRLVGSLSSNVYERLGKARVFAKHHHIHVVLKGAYTACIHPDGEVHFNSTGNPGMATAGSGDVLTGIIVSLLAQGYLPGIACRLGVYVHGLSGDIALGSQSYESLIASDLVDNLGLAFKQLEQ